MLVLPVFLVLFSAVSLLTGVVFGRSPSVLKMFLGTLGRLPGKVAAGNIRQNLGRTGVAIAAFMISLSMSIGLGAMIGSFPAIPYLVDGDSNSWRSLHWKKLLKQKFPKISMKRFEK